MRKKSIFSQTKQLTQYFFLKKPINMYDFLPSYFIDYLFIGLPVC